MIGRRLARRLERLETRLVPDGEPLVIQVRFVSPDGSRVDGPQFTVPRAGGRPAGPAGPPGLADRRYGRGLHR
jgi:hypothetical protein